MSNVLLTGSSGFIGQTLLKCLQEQAFHKVHLALRHSPQAVPTTAGTVVVGDILPNTNWGAALIDTHAVIHLAARAHILNDTATDPLAAFRETNTAGTLNLARQAADAGVRRFIFISSIGVNGNQTFGKPFTATDTPKPVEPYAISKHEAEIGLRQIAFDTGMEVVIIRPPLVYGANAPGNFGRLIRTLARGIPLPLGNIRNHRSLVALPNLIDLITTCIDHPAAANQTFLVSDGEDLSTPDLLRRLGEALGKPARLLPIPQAWLENTLTLLGKHAIAQRLCGSLQIDLNHTRNTLGWTPPISVDAALRQTAQAYLQSQR